jgi:hypothetical protein
MDTPGRDYSVLRQEHARAIGELNQHVEQQKGPAVEAGDGDERISAAERVAAPEAERPSAPSQPQRGNYAILKEEHARTLDALNAHGSRSAESDHPEVTAEAEPTRPTEIRTPGWTSAGGRVEQETSARAWDKVAQQRRARQALDRHIEDRRDPSVDTPDAAPSKTPDRDRGDGGVER